MTVPTARALRRRMTDAERVLWRVLRDSRLDRHKFRRQQPLGRYVVDFYCRGARLVIEVDGGQHQADEPAEAARTEWLEQEGHRVLRFWNNDVLSNIDGVKTAILAALRDGY